MRLPSWLTSRPPKAVTDDLSVPDLRKLLRALRQAHKDRIISGQELTQWYAAAEETVRIRTETVKRARADWGL
jgi:hypothetical protein